MANIPTGQKFAGQFSEKDDGSIEKETYMTNDRPTYPFDGAKTTKKGGSSNGGGGHSNSNGKSGSNFDSDLQANGGDAGAPVPRKDSEKERGDNRGDKDKEKVKIRPVNAIVSHQQTLSAASGFPNSASGYHTPGFSGSTGIGNALGTAGNVHGSHGGGGSYPTGPQGFGGSNCQSK